MKKIYIIHGWGGYPEECWFIWLKNKLEEKGYQAFVPQMPDADAPNIEKWVNHLKELIKPDQDTYLVGHSIGCQTIMRYLQTIDVKVGGVVFVAGFYNLTEEVTKDPEDSVIAKPWLETPIDDNKVKQNANKITSIFSDNDPYVPLSDSELFKQRLGGKIVILHNKGHMGGSDKMDEHLIVFDELMEMIG